jgi:hypothetical protein
MGWIFAIVWIFGVYAATLVAGGTDLRTAQTLLRHANLNDRDLYAGGRREACRGDRPARSWYLTEVVIACR